MKTYTEAEVIQMLEAAKKEFAEEAYECIICDFGQRQTQDELMSIDVKKFLI